MIKPNQFHQSVPGVALVTLLILLVPFVAMQYTDEVNWSLADFIFAGALLFGIGLSFVLVILYASSIIYRVAISLTLATTFFMVWANLAVGLIGAGPNPGNLMYIGVIAVGIIGIIISRCTPRGMEYTMYVMALTVALVAAIALKTGMQYYPGSSMAEVAGINGFFAALFALSGLLFRFVAYEQSRRIEKLQG